MVDLVRDKFGKPISTLKGSGGDEWLVHQTAKTLGQMRPEVVVDGAVSTVNHGKRECEAIIVVDPLAMSWDGKEDFMYAKLIKACMDNPNALVILPPDALYPTPYRGRRIKGEDLVEAAAVLVNIAPIETSGYGMQGLGWADPQEEIRALNRERKDDSVLYQTTRIDAYTWTGMKLEPEIGYPDGIRVFRVRAQVENTVGGQGTIRIFPGEKPTEPEYTMTQLEDFSFTLRDAANALGDLEDKSGQPSKEGGPEPLSSHFYRVHYAIPSLDFKGDPYQPTDDILPDKTWGGVERLKASIKVVLEQGDQLESDERFPEKWHSTGKDMSWSKYWDELGLKEYLQKWGKALERRHPPGGAPPQ